MQENKTQNHSTQAPIDAVILWVDGSDRQHQNKILPYLEDKSKLLSKKFRTRFDQVNEIKFTIDSILKFDSYKKNIIIITDEQSHDFLKDKNNAKTYKKVSIIDHKIIFKNYEAFMSVFNCRPIETFIYRLPYFAEQFIYFNDDFFLI